MVARWSLNGHNTIIKCNIYVFPFFIKYVVSEMVGKDKKIPEESRIPLRKEMLKRMVDFIEKFGKAEGIYNYTELTRRAINDFLKKYEM